LEEIDDERNQALPATMVSTRRIIPRTRIDDIGRMDEKAYIEFSDRQFNRITRGRCPRTVGERFGRRCKYLGSRESGKFTMEGTKKGGKADTVAADTGAAVIADRRNGHCKNSNHSLYKPRPRLSIFSRPHVGVCGTTYYY